MHSDASLYGHHVFFCHAVTYLEKWDQSNEVLIRFTVNQIGSNLKLDSGDGPKINQKIIVMVLKLKGN